MMDSDTEANVSDKAVSGVSNEMMTSVYLLVRCHPSYTPNGLFGTCYSTAPDPLCLAPGHHGGCVRIKQGGCLFRFLLAVHKERLKT